MGGCGYVIMIGGCGMLSDRWMWCVVMIGVAI